LLNLAASRTRGHRRCAAVRARARWRPRMSGGLCRCPGTEAHGPGQHPQRSR